MNEQQAINVSSVIEANDVSADFIRAWRAGVALLILPLLAALSASVAHAEEALVDGYHIKPESATVMTGESIILKLVYCTKVNISQEKRNEGKKKAEPEKKSEEKTGKQDDDELAPLVMPEENGKNKPDDDLAPLDVMRLVCEDDPGAGKYLGELTPLVTPKNVKWEVSSGQGKVSGDNNRATYQAPATKPNSNKATVTATVTYKASKEKTIHLSRITILDLVKTYSGTFQMDDVAINEEYKTHIAGNISFDFTEYYDIGGWREYEGKGTATYSLKRKSCKSADFAGVPVEGRLKVFDDGRYEFEVGLVGEAQVVTHCKNDDAKWEEEITPGGAAMHSGDPCAMKEFYPRYDDVGVLSFTRKGKCSLVRDAYNESWSFTVTR